jgi:hypothetical protein
MMLSFNISMYIRVACFCFSTYITCYCFLRDFLSKMNNAFEQFFVRKYLFHRFCSMMNTFECFKSIYFCEHYSATFNFFHCQNDGFALLLHLLFFKLCETNHILGLVSVIKYAIRRFTYITRATLVNEVRFA